MESEGSRTFRSSNKKGWDKNRRRENQGSIKLASVKIVDGGLYFIFSFHFLFLFFFSFLFHFSIFRTTRVRVHQSRCHISHKLMA